MSIAEGDVEMGANGLRSTVTTHGGFFEELLHEAHQDK